MGILTDDFKDRIAELEAENAQLRQQVGRLEDENIFLQEKLALEENPNTTLGKKVRELENANRKLRAQAEEMLDLKAKLTTAENQNAALRDVANELAQACRTHAEVRKRENEPASNANHATFYQIFEITQKVDKILSSPPSNRIAKLERVAKAAVEYFTPILGGAPTIKDKARDALEQALADLKGGECGED